MKRALLLCLLFAGCGGTSKPAHSSYAEICATASQGDPAEMSLCLARHHIILSDSVRACVTGVRDRAKLIACMKEAAR
jgi:hypothetical protein